MRPKASLEMAATGLRKGLEMAFSIYEIHRSNVVVCDGNGLAMGAESSQKRAVFSGRFGGRVWGGAAVLFGNTLI
jgi:hypothetical protein